jgi:hypothetical protein
MVSTAPFPVNGTVCGEPGALSEISTFAVLTPGADGAKVTEIEQNAPDATLLEQLSVSVKSLAALPVTLMGELKVS